MHERTDPSLFLVCFVLGYIFAPSMSHAGGYDFVRGTGLAVCDAYKANLDSSAVDIPYNCDRPVSPKNRLMTKPKWQKVNGVDNFDLVVKIDKFLQPDLHSPASGGYLDNLRQRVLSGALTIVRTDLDIDNDGNKEALVMVEYGPCEPGASRGWWAKPLLVVDFNKREVDKNMTALLLQNHSMNKHRDPVGGWKYQMYDLFLYSGRLYFDKWSDVQDEKGSLRVYAVKNGDVMEICEYRYKD